jgi:hypothetical protein
MPGYVAEALHQFQHPNPTRKVDAPSPWTAPDYGVKVQLTKPADTSQRMDADNTLRLQRIVGKLLYYCRAVDSTMQHALSTLATQQTTGTQQTMDDLTILLNYCASHPDIILRFQRSEMILRVDSDAAYLTEPGARSRVGGFLYLGNKQDSPRLFNGPVLTISRVIRAVMSAASEAECGALFINCQEAIPLRIALEELGHPQPATPVACDNSTATGIMNRKMKQQRSKAMDMRFYWVQDRVDQEQFRIYWESGRTNNGDYYTKHHNATHHRLMRPVVSGTITQENALEYLRGCVDPSPGPPKRAHRIAPIGPQPESYAPGKARPAIQIPNGNPRQQANHTQAGGAFLLAITAMAKATQLVTNT